jgi:adenosylcobinamide kinase/adenosylcobinamide-phosphate guanylyltransferase
VYVAAATALDDEMTERIARHRAQRPSTWQTIETPTGLAAAVQAAAHEPGRAGQPPAQTVLVEDLTLLLSNLMALDAERAEGQAIAEVNALLGVPAHLILISNEVGMGIVPAFALGRLFRDALGRVNQAAAAVCSEAFLLVAGLPLRLK